MTKIIASLICFLFCVSLSSQTTYLHCGSVLDCNGISAAKEQTIIVEGNKNQRD